MQHVVLDGVEPGSVVRAVDARTYARGVLFAQRRAVAEMEWDGERNALYTDVRDSGVVHEAVAYFRVRRERLDFDFGECTCPAGMNCVHVVASVLAAADTAGVGRTGTAGAHPPWERTLRSLFAPDPPSLNDLREPVPLAVELSLGALSAGHARSVALRELYALHSAGSGPSRYHYGGSDRTIELAGVGRGLWSVLDEAADVGLQIVHARKRFGTVDRYGSAQLCLDVTSGPAAEALEIAPALRMHAAEETDADALPILFLGAEGHGVVHVSRAQSRVDPDPAHWRFRLARLATPAPPPLRRLVLEGGISVPDDQRARFLEEFYPRLSRLAPVASSDMSFTPPAVVLPELVLHAAYGDGHALTVRWEWAYAVGGTRVRFPLASSAADEAVRDLAHEQAALDALDLPPFATGLLRADGPGSALLPQVRLDGLDTMRLSTEVLPLLADTDGVVVEVDGSPAVYRETGDLLQVGVSTAESDSGTDWFDLGIRISVEGRDVPFADVFGALAAGESHLLLPDGAYFSLQKPELQALRTLIEEARALQDSPSGPLRLSRFQAGLWDELAALGVVDAQARAWQQQVTGLLADGGPAATPVPAGLRAQLRPYQRDGVDWLCYLWRHGLGGVLADDMGLGRTCRRSP